ncbi:hypothetical protein [Streptomyces lasalocidi]|uniref:Uncharacterized protein n=1 Tax=Streptomyces lasalocidi TaxID=324833 RepID=A0A4U5W7V5_STRLS|nr:hypothetical protein [Streptomyces lasalocidi]TKS96215.1 hypothetical protein E4U91_36440 [Streptomyces lasalocidi]
MIGTSIGAFGGYFAGRAQGRATVDGVRLQLSGQREDAVWQAELDAFAALIDQFNAARMQIGTVVAKFEASRRELRRLSPHGGGTREEAYAALMECVRELVVRENALRLRTARTYANAATAVRVQLLDVLEVLQAYCVARARGRRAWSLHRQFTSQMAGYISDLDAFVRDAQERFSRPRPGS